MRKMVKRALNTMGFTILEEAEDGEEAWAKLNANPDIGFIISDWNMAPGTGVEFLRRVRADQRFKNLPFILLTAEGEASQIKEALQAGVDSYILKPFTVESLKEKFELTYKKRIAA